MSSQASIQGHKQAAAEAMNALRIVRREGRDAAERDAVKYMALSRLARDNGITLNALFCSVRRIQWKQFTKEVDAWAEEGLLRREAAPSRNSLDVHFLTPAGYDFVVSHADGAQGTDAR